MKPKLLIDDLLEYHLPKRYYGHEARKNAKRLALQFFDMARQQCAMEEEINWELWTGELSNDDRDKILKRWGYKP